MDEFDCAAALDHAEAVFLKAKESGDPADIAIARLDLHEIRRLWKLEFRRPLTGEGDAGPQPPAHQVGMTVLNGDDYQ